MGCEVRRVPLDFDWPLNQTWAGFLNPYYKHRHNCTPCGGSGLNPETRQISEDWYDHDGFWVRWTYRYGHDGRACAIVGDCRRWCDKLTQDEVDALVEAGRLREWRGRDNGGWVSVPRTAAEVNAANAPGARGFGHDAINRGICVKTRATRLGVYGHCAACNGKGHVWENRGWKRLAKKWRTINPPKGDAYQVWETTSEGSPISPPFATPEELARWLADHGASSFGSQTATYEEWLAFARGPGWAPSAVSVDGGPIVSGVVGSREKCS